MTTLPIPPALLHAGLDAADLKAAAFRLGVVADRIAGAVDASRIEDRDGCFSILLRPADGGGTILHSTRMDSGIGLAEHWSMDTLLPTIRDTSLTVQIEAGSTSAPTIDASPADIAARLRRIVDGIATAAERAAVGRDAEIPCAPATILSRLLAETLPGRLPDSIRVVTRLHADGTLRTTANSQLDRNDYDSIPVLAPAANDALQALCVPAGRLAIRPAATRCEYVVDCIRSVVPKASEGRDAMRRMRDAAALAALGPAPFTDVFLDLHARVAR